MPVGGSRTGLFWNRGSCWVVVVKGQEGFGMGRILLVLFVMQFDLCMVGFFPVAVVVLKY